MAAYTTTQSSPGLLDTLRNTWGSRGNAKPALGLDLDRSFEELQRPKKGFLRSVVRNSSPNLLDTNQGKNSNVNKMAGFGISYSVPSNENTYQVLPNLYNNYTCYERCCGRTELFNIGMGFMREAITKKKSQVICSLMHLCCLLTTNDLYL